MESAFQPDKPDPPPVEKKPKEPPAPPVPGAAPVAKKSESKRNETKKKDQVTLPLRGDVGGTPAGGTPNKRILRVTRYDRVAALLVALLVIIGSIVFMMTVVWASGRVFVKQPTIAAQMIELSGGGNAMGAARELDEPGAEEIEELLEPQMEETIDAVTDILSSKLATLDSLGADSAMTSAGSGAGDGRQPGEGGESNVIPRWQRWQLIFAVGNLAAYAKQLDYFKIELGAAGGAEQIDYAYNLSQAQPDQRTGDPDEEQRLYMTWRYGPLRAADVQLLKRAGVRTDNRIIMQFIPPDIENQLAIVEMEFLKENRRAIKDIRQTTFEVVGRGGQYEFRVKSQRTR